MTVSITDLPVSLARLASMRADSSTALSSSSRSVALRIGCLLSDEAIERFDQRIHLLPERAAIGLPLVPGRAQRYCVAIAIGSDGCGNALHVQRNRQVGPIGADFGQGGDLGETGHIGKRSVSGQDALLVLGLQKALRPFPGDLVHRVDKD